jgi:phosphatidylserine/phosphatidylglycerophosphate/cardiolipin synthase-like enzyme
VLDGPPSVRNQEIGDDQATAICHAFLSSANLTEYAFSLNMELGLLITGGEQPPRVEDHFDRLIEIGMLIRP